MVQWGANQYTTTNYFNDAFNTTTMQLLVDSGLRHVLAWQWNLTATQLVSLGNLCQSTNPPITLWVDLSDYTGGTAYTTSSCVDAVTRLGNLCKHYEVCKEPHVSGHCYQTAANYAQKWRTIVQACRAVTDGLSGTTWYGGPVSGRPTNRLAWYQEWLDLNSDIISASNTFLSYHWYTHYSGTLPSQSTLISTATSQIASDVADFNDECTTYLGTTLPVALTEFNWTADPAASPDYSRTDATFMTNWTNAAMQACVDNSVWAAFFWSWAAISSGYDNTMNILRPASTGYTPEFQYYSIQDFLSSSEESSKAFSGDAWLLAATPSVGSKSFTGDGYLMAQTPTAGTTTFSGDGWLTGGLGIRVASSADDAHHRLTNDWYSNTTSYLRAGYVSATDKRYRVGMRFLDLEIPQGSTIDSAYIRLTARYTKAGVTANCTLKGELADNAATFSTSDDFDSRPRTTVSVAWNNIAAWTADSTYDSPELKTIVQEIVDQTDWVSGNSLVIFWDDDSDTSSASREAYSYNQDPTKAPLLTVSYTTSGIESATKSFSGDGYLMTTATGIPFAFYGDAVLESPVSGASDVVQFSGDGILYTPTPTATTTSPRFQSVLRKLKKTPTPYKMIIGERPEVGVGGTPIRIGVYTDHYEKIKAKVKKT